MKFYIVLSINISYCILLLLHPKSELYNLQSKSSTEIIDYYQANITTDTASYAYQPPKDIRRTIGYPLVLKFFMKLNHFLLWMLLFNCFLGAWLFYVSHQLIGRWVWMLFLLGAYTAHVPLLLSDLLFATIFVTSIWQIKRLWLHFLLLGLASLVRPNLAYFFLIEPIILYYAGYRGDKLIYGFLIAAMITSFTPARNYINNGIWTHSDILSANIHDGRYFGGRESIPQYFIKSLKDNMLSDHYKYMGNAFNVFKIANSGREASITM